METRVGSEFIGATELPWTEGTHRGEDVHEADPALRAGRWTFTGLALDHVFYNADFLQLTGVVSHPVDVFWAEQRLPVQEAPFRLESPRPVLFGLPTPLDHYVYACPKVHAPRLLAFLDRFAVGDPTAQYWESVHQRMMMIDWKMVERLTSMPDKPPMIEIHLYGLQGPEQVYHWGRPKDPWKQPIWLGATPRKKIQPGQKRKFPGRRIL